MPKRAKELSALEVKRLTEPGLHFVGGAAGLALQVLPTGGRTWVLRTMVGGKRREMGLGSFEDVSLAKAREKALEARDAIKAGVDPIAKAQAARLQLKASAAAVLTFRKAAATYIEAHRPSWRNPKHAQQWENTLAQYVFPLIGDLAVSDLTIANVLQVLEQPVPKERVSTELVKLWEGRTETASRLRGRIEVILDWCKGRGYRSGDNPAAWKGCLDAQLPKPNRIAKVKHHAAMPIDQMGSFMAELRQRQGVAARALEFSILCASRSGEVRGMKWNEIDRANWIWTIPADRMKAGRDHRVPLSSSAVELLANIPRIEGSDLVFTAPRGGVLSDMTLTAVMRRMGLAEVPHGFRSTFRDWVSPDGHLKLPHLWPPKLLQAR
jgi:integrase